MENELLKIGGAYIRVSDERQDEYSPDSQLKKIREYAAKEGYIIPDEYVFYDDGISGKNVKNRDSFNLMIAVAKEQNRPFDVIYVWKLSRFARNQEQSIVYKNLLQKIGVSVKSVSEPIPEGPFGTLIERIIEWMDEFYLINLGAEVSRGMAEKVSRGEPVVYAPFGYINAEKTYLPDEESGAADIIREIFQRYADGEKQREIAVSLGQRGIRTKRGNLPENRWVDYILWNPAYIGKIRWTSDGSKAVRKRDFTNENIVLYDGNWQPLISMELWEKVQNMLATQKKKYSKYAKPQLPANYMLKGLVRCGNCSATLAMSSVVSGKNKTRTMQCCNYSKGTCTVSHSITMPKLEAALIKHTGLKGNRATPLASADLHECRETSMPAVLLELGFMDSKVDVPIILTEDYANKCANAIVEVIAAKGGLTKKKVETPIDTAKYEAEIKSLKEQNKALQSKIEQIKAIIQ